MVEGQESGKSEPPGRSSSAVTLEIRRHIKDLTSPDYAVRDRSVTELEKFGKPAAQALVDRLLTRTVSHDLLRTFEDAFEEIGKPCVNVLVHGLDQIQEIRKAEDVYLLELFVETLGRVGDRRMGKVVVDQLEKLNRRIKLNHARLLTDVCMAAKVRIHSVLAGFDSPAGLDDLLGMLGDGRRRVRDGVVAAVEKVGDRRAIVPLVRLYAIEEAVTFSGALLIKSTIREIARREKVSPKDKVFKDLNPEERALMEKLLGSARA